MTGVPVEIPDLLRAAVADALRNHTWREIDVRSDHCRVVGAFQPCNSEGDPACSEECFETIRVCNACGTRETCSLQALRDAYDQTLETT